MYISFLAKPTLGNGIPLFSLVGPREGLGPTNTWELADSNSFLSLGAYLYEYLQKL